MNVATTVARCELRRLPAGHIISVDTNDFEEFCDFLVGWNVDQQLIGRGKPRIKTFGVVTPSFQLGLVEHSTGYCSQGENLKGCVTLLAAVDEAQPMVHCGRSVDKLELCVTHSGTGFELVNRFGSCHLVASISATVLDQYAADLWGEPSMFRHSADRFHFPGTTHRRHYVQVCQRILNDVQLQPDLLANPRAAALLEARLLENILPQFSPEPRYVNATTRNRVARRAYQYLLDQLEEVPTIRDLCAVTGASYATLERGFQETYGLSPRTYLKAVRLSRARKELRHPDKDTAVTKVALHWGFLELGRFSVEYHHRFGETPSETLRNARGDSPLLVKDSAARMCA